MDSERKDGQAASAASKEKFGGTTPRAKGFGRGTLSLKAVATNVISGFTAYAEEQRLKDVKNAVRLAVGDGIRLLSEMSLEQSMARGSRRISDGQGGFTEAADSEQEIIAQVENTIFGILQREVKSSTDLQTRLRKAEHRMDFMQQQLEKRSILAQEQREELLKELSAAGENHRHWFSKHSELLEQYRALHRKVTVLQSQPSFAQSSSVSGFQSSATFTLSAANVAGGSRQEIQERALMEASARTQGPPIEDPRASSTTNLGNETTNYVDVPQISDRMSDDWTRLFADESRTENQNLRSQDADSRIKGMHLKLKQEQELIAKRGNKKMDDLIKLETTKIENRCRQLEMQLRRKEIEMERTGQLDKEKWKAIQANTADSHRMVNKSLVENFSRREALSKMELADVESQAGVEFVALRDTRDQARSAVVTVSRENDMLRRDLEKTRSMNRGGGSGDIKGKEMSKAYERTAKSLQSQLVASQVELDNVKEDHATELEAANKERISLTAKVMNLETQVSALGETKGEKQREYAVTIAKLTTERNEAQHHLEKAVRDHGEEVDVLKDKIDLLLIQLDDLKQENERLLDKREAPAVLSSVSPVRSLDTPDAALSPNQQQQGLPPSLIDGDHLADGHHADVEGAQAAGASNDQMARMQRELDQAKAMVSSLRRDLVQNNANLTSHTETVTSTPSIPASLLNTSGSKRTKPSQSLHHSPHNRSSQSRRGESPIGSGLGEMVNITTSPATESISPVGSRVDESAKRAFSPPSALQQRAKTVSVVSPKTDDADRALQQVQQLSSATVSRKTASVVRRGSDGLSPWDGATPSGDAEMVVPAPPQVQGADTPEVMEDRSASALGGRSGSKTPGGGPSRPFVASLGKPHIAPRGLSRNSNEGSMTDRSIKRTQSPPSNSPRVAQRSEEMARKSEEKRRVLKAHQSHLAELVAVTEDPHPHLIATQNALLRPHGAATPGTRHDLATETRQLHTHQLEELVGQAQVAIQQASSTANAPPATGAMSATSTAKHLQNISSVDVRFYQRCTGTQTDSVNFLEPPPDLKFPSDCFHKVSAAVAPSSTNATAPTAGGGPEDDDFAVVLVCQPFVNFLGGVRCSVLQAPYLYKEALVTPKSKTSTVLPIPESDTERKRIIQVLNATAQDALKKLRASSGASLGSAGLGAVSSGVGGARFPSPSKHQHSDNHGTVNVATLVPPPEAVLFAPHVPTQSATLAKRSRQRPQSATSRNPNHPPAAAETPSVEQGGSKQFHDTLRGDSGSHAKQLSLKSNPFALLKATRPRSAGALRSGAAGTQPAPQMRVAVQELCPFN